MSKGSIIVAVIIALAGGFTVGKLMGKSPGEQELENLDIGEGAGSVERFKVPVTDAQPVFGPTDALVTIVEFSDFECPFCSRVVPTIKKIESDYGNKVRVVWRNNPLPFHSNAMPAAKLAVEAFKQGGSKKFWQIHDLLFNNQRALGRADLEKYAGQAGLDMGKVRAALDGNAHTASIQADQEVATKLDARGTPGFFINGRKLMGAQPFEEFKKVIDEEIKIAEALTKKGTSRKQVYAALMKDAKEAATPEAPAQPEARPSEPDPDAVYKVPVTSAEPQKGPADALVTIVAFSDFECPFCSRVLPTMKQIEDKYGNKVRFAWRNNPLPFHSNAMPAALAAMEAFAQGGSKKFWQMHDLLFANQKALGRPDLDKYATQVGLNLEKFKKAVDGQAHKAKITADQGLATSLGANGTPSFFINGRNLRGAQPFENFAALIDVELKKAEDKVKAGTPKAKLYDEIIKDGATAPKVKAAAAGDEAGEQPGKKYTLAVPAKAPRKGAKNAKVIIQEFSDFQCPFCSRVLPTVGQIMQTYGDKVQIVWRNYPLPFHDKAQLAAEAALEAFAQKGDKAFWAFHDTLFANQQALGRPDLEKYAQEAGLDMARFKKALDAGTHKAAVKADMDAVAKAGAQIGTPSFFINGELVQGAVPFEAFKPVIDKALAGK